MQQRLALHFELVPRGGNSDPDAAFLAACSIWLGLGGGKGLDWDEPFNQSLEGGRILRWAPHRTKTTTLADIVVHAPDPLDRTLQWSTHVTYAWSEKLRRRELNIRVSTDGGPVGGGATPPVRPPRLLPELDTSFLLVSNDGPLLRVPTQLEGGTLDAFVRYVLCDPARTVPVLLLTELPDGGFIIPPEQFGNEMFGLGACYLLRHADTFALSDSVGGHARSVFLGSARAYLPGFALESDPFHHPLVLARALSLPGERRRLVQRLAEVSIQRPLIDAEFIDKLRDDRTASYQKLKAAKEAMEATEIPDSIDREQLIATAREYGDTLREIQGELSRNREELSNMRAEIKKERKAVRTLRTTLAALKEHQPLSRPASDEPESVIEAVERAQMLYGDSLRFLPSAITSAEESSFPDPLIAWSYLKALGEVGRRLQDRALARPLAEVFADLGVDFVSGADQPTEAFTFKDGDREVECPDHLRKGNNPLTCLRIYFSSSEDGGFVIGHVGKQIDEDQSAAE